MAKKKAKKTVGPTRKKKVTEQQIVAEEKVLKNDFFKPYYWAILVLAVLNLVATVMLPFVQIDFSSDFFLFLGIITLLELPLLLWSIGLIVYVELEGIGRRLLAFPFFYLVVYVSLAAFGFFMIKKGLDPFDYSLFENKLALIVSLIFYAAQILFAYQYLFKNRIKTKNTRKLNRKRFLKR